MKVTLGFSQNISAVNDNYSKIKPRYAAAEFNDQYWHTPHVLTPGSWSNAQPGTASLYKHTTDLCSLMTTKKHHLLKKHPTPSGISPISAPRLPPALQPAQHRYNTQIALKPGCSVRHHTICATTRPVYNSQPLNHCSFRRCLEAMSAYAANKNLLPASKKMLTVTADWKCA